MSWQATNYVTEHSKHKGGSFLCLLMIANCADQDGRNSWPSIEKLAKDCRMSERQIQRIIVALEKTGEIRIQRCAGPNKKHKFTVMMGHVETPAKSAGGPHSPRQNVRVTKCRGDISDDSRVTFPSSEGDITVSPKQRNDPKNNPSFSGGKPQKEKRPASLEDVKTYGREIGLPPDRCEDFWDKYESNGWVNKDGPIDDWRAALRRFKRYGPKVTPSASPPDNATEPREGVDWCLHASSADEALYYADPETKDPFDAIAWYAARPHLTPTAKWRRYMDQQRSAA